MQLKIPRLLFNQELILIELGIVANMTTDGKHHYEEFSDRYVFNFNAEDKSLVIRVMNRMFREAHSQILYLHNQN